MPLIFRPTALKLPVHKFNKYLQTLLVTEFTFLFSYSANIDVFFIFFSDDLHSARFILYSFSADQKFLPLVRYWQPYRTIDRNRVVETKPLSALDALICLMPGSSPSSNH